MAAPQEPDPQTLIIGFQQQTGDMTIFATYEKDTKKRKNWYIIGLDTHMTWPALHKWATRQKICLIPIPT